VGEKRNEYKVLAGKTEGNKSVGWLGRGGYC